MKPFFNKPQESTHNGWFVSTNTKRNMLCKYLHSDGKLYKCAYNDKGVYTGYFKTEAEAYAAMYDYTVSN